MGVLPISGKSGDLLVAQLRSALTALGNLGGGDVQQRFTDYMHWASTYAGFLGDFLRREDLDQLITTRGYWTLQTFIPVTSSAPERIGGHAQKNINALISLEILERNRELGQVINELSSDLIGWGKVNGSLILADTNVYLHHEKIFSEVPWRDLLDAAGRDAHLIIPILIVNELDGKKRTGQGTVSETNDESVRTRARKSLNLIDEIFRKPLQEVELTLRNSAFGLVTASIFMDSRDHVRIMHSDSELVDRALALQNFTGRDITIITFDTGMALRARMANLKVINLTKMPKNCLPG
jgi:hypothetical protein